MTSPLERALLYSRLKEVLGDQSAVTLMTLLPPSDGLPTRSDLDAVEGRLGSRMDRLGSRMDRLGSRMDRLEERMDRLEVRMDRFEDKLDGFHESLRGYSRTFIAAQTASTFGVAGLVLAITQLL